MIMGQYMHTKKAAIVSDRFASDQSHGTLYEEETEESVPDHYCPSRAVCQTVS